VNSVLVDDLKYIHKNLTNKHDFENSTILITGAAGFLGFEILNYFSKYFAELSLKKIYALDNLITGNVDWINKLVEENDNIEFFKFNIINDELDDISKDLNPDFIIHMASIASPTFYRKYPLETIDANVWGLRKLLDKYNNTNLKGFLYFSTSEIYGDPDSKNIPTSEEYKGNVSSTGPRACYDESKRLGETLCLTFNKKYNFPVGIARPFNNYGPGMNIMDRRVPADFANNIINNKKITLFSDGKPTRTFCYVADAIVGYLSILLNGHGDFFNIGIDQNEISMRDFANIYIKTGHKLGIYTHKEFEFCQSNDPNYLTDNPNRRCPIIKKAKEKLGYNPSIQIDEGVEKFLKFLIETIK
jgi:UDP-glucuronate decarboxylase